MRTTGGAPGLLALKTLTARPQEPLQVVPFAQTSSPGGLVWSEFYRDASGILVRFPNYADFLISMTGGDVRCRPTPDVSDDVLEHLFRNQVAPLVWSRDGSIALHASSVVTSKYAVAFVGETGRGKSTLAAYLAGQGNHLVTDDTLLIERDNGAFLALPGPEQIRLWSDSGDILLGPDAQLLPRFNYTSKGRYSASGLFALAEAPAPLKQLYFLADEAAKEVTISRISGAKALFSITNSSFLLDWMDRNALAEHFENVTALCGAVETFTLDYPRRYDALGQVEAAVAARASARASEGTLVW